jgi:enterochelin esterase-like enzyme
MRSLGEVRHYETFMARTHPLIARARLHGAPLIDGHKVTFVWEGKTAPLLLGDFTDWRTGDPLVLVRQAREVWAHTLTLPETAYIEYAYFADVEGDQRLGDPYNPRKVSNGYGKYNHYFYMPGRHPSALIRRSRKLPRGRIISAVLPTQGMISGQERKVHLYQPPVPGPYPLVLVWDGQDFLRRARLPAILDHLIQQKQICPLALALVESHGPVRMLEYCCNDFSLGFVLERVLPFANQNLDLVDPQRQPGAFGVLGASMGGLMALYTGLRLPAIFGRVLSLSGAFSFPDFDFVVYDLVRNADPHALHIWMEVGSYDIQSLLDSNRRMSGLLQERGYDLSYGEYPAGHNYNAWRDEVGRGLEALFMPQNGSE